MSTFTHDRPETDVHRNSGLSAADDFATNNPLQAVLNATIRAQLGIHRGAYNALVISKTGTEFNQSQGIANANVGLASLRMACSHCQQVVKFKVDEGATGWTPSTLSLYDMNPGHPLVSSTTSLDKLKTVAKAIKDGEYIRVVTNGGVPLDFAVNVVTLYDALIVPLTGLLALRSASIVANNANIVSMRTLNDTVDPFITLFQDLVLASGGGLTKAEVHAIGIAWGLRFIHIGNPSTFNIELQDDVTFAKLAGGECAIGKGDPLLPTDPILAHGAKGTTNEFGTTVIMTKRFGAIEIIVDMPGYNLKVVPMTTLEASTHTVVIALTKTPPITLI
jgi:hypothetical protein